MTHPHPLTADLITAAQQLTSPLLRVHTALRVIHADEHLSALLNAPPSLQRGLLNHALTLRDHTDPGALEQILNLTFSAPDLLRAVQTFTADPAAQPSTTQPSATQPSTTQFSPPHAAPAQPTQTGAPDAVTRAAQAPTAPPPATPAPTPGPLTFTLEQAELRRLTDWDFPELSRYLLNRAQLDLHPRTLKAIKQGTHPDPLTSDVLTALRAVPTTVTYTDPDDPRNSDSVHFETFYDLRAQISDLTSTRTSDAIAAQLRASTGLTSLTRATIDQVLRAHFAEGRHWVIDLPHLPVLTAALRALSHSSADADPTRDAPAPTDPDGDDVSPNYRARIRALEDKFGQTIFTTKQASEILKISTNDTRKFLQSAVQKLRCTELAGRRWHLN